MWGSSASRQMHNKFITVSKALGSNGGIMKDITYVSTANIDGFGGHDIDDDTTELEYQNSLLPVNKRLPKFNLAQSGVMIYSHPGLYNAYNKYFELIWENASDTDNKQFKSDVRAQHQDRTLNYSDNHFSAYFYPMRHDADGYETAWNSYYNPITLLSEKLSLHPTSTKYVKINAYTIEDSNQNDPFVNKFNSHIEDLKKGDEDSVHLRSVIYKANQPNANSVDEYDGQKIGWDALTHNKTYLFGFPRDDEYYSITGSTNFKSSGFRWKGNNLIMIKESRDNRKVYNNYKKMFYNVYSKRDSDLTGD